MSLDRLFRARSVAVVGASQTPGKTGHTILKNIVDGGFTGSLFPVNPRAQEILGLPAYPTIAAIGKPVDLAVVVVPAPAVPSVIRDAAGAGVKAAAIITGGFGEIGNRDLEREVLDLCQSAGIRVIGPNCQGFNYTGNDLCATWPLVTRKGPLAIISQSGTVGAALSGWAEEEGLGISGFVALGNKADVNETELMEFFAEDPDTKVIALYLEQVKNGREFLRVAGEVTRKKPVIALKGGRTAEGRAAAQSHTRSVAGRYEVFESACRKAGVIPAKDTIQLYDFAKAAAFLKRPEGKRVMIVTSSGGSGILATDAAVDSGLVLAGLPAEAKEALRGALPPQCVINNPLDLTGDADAARYLTAVKTLAGHRVSDVSILVFGDPIPGAREAIEEMMSAGTSVVGVVYIGGGEVGREESFKLQTHGIPVFPTPERAVRALAALN